MTFRFAWCIGLLFALVTPSIANAAPPQETTGLSALDLFALAERAKAEGRAADAYALCDALAQDPSGEIRTEARFRKAALLASEKRYAESAVLLRRILDDVPQATRVRLELARVLAEMGEETAARRALRQAQASGLPPDVAITVEQFARALRSTRRFGGSIEVSLVPDSNINRATQARTLDTVIAPLTLSADARAQTGLGTKVSGSAFVRIPLTDRLSILPRLSWRRTSGSERSGICHIERRRVRSCVARFRTGHRFCVGSRATFEKRRQAFSFF